LFASEREGELDVFSMSPDGTNVVRLSDDATDDDHPRFSAGGDWIIFNSKRHDGENYQLWVMDSDGTSPRRLSWHDGWDTYPSFSADDSQVLWRRVLPSGGWGGSGRNSEIFVMNADGTGTRNLTNHPAFDGYPALSPDGRLIAFASDRESPGMDQIFVMSANGASVTRLSPAEHGVQYARPAWSPDGKRIAGTREKDGVTELAILELQHSIHTELDAAVELPHLQGLIELDGIPDETAWQEAVKLRMVGAVPVYGAEPSETTEVIVGYDESFLYVAGRFHDSASASLRVGSLTRDRPGNDDGFELVLDTYADNENAVGFATNPAGVRVDFTVANDGEPVVPNRPSDDPAWNTFWDVETRIAEDGWTMEMRIPLSSLRFQVVADEVSMGLIARRTIARKNEEVTFPPIPPEWSGSYRKPSLARKVVLRGITSSRPVYLSPYVVAGRKHPRQTSGLDGLPAANDLDVDLGIDAKYGLADNLVLDLTLNTDFAQSEADAEQVSRGRFSLFFPEKRQFFLERAGIFDFTGLGNVRLFHSRRIGLSEDGIPVSIIGGGRLVGRVGEWDLGMLDMQTAASATTPSENFGVFRVRRRTFNAASSAGLMITSRIPGEGPSSVSLGLDGTVHFGGRTYAGGSVSQSRSGGRGSLASTAGVFQFERRSGNGFSYSQSLGWTGSDYNPGVGFVDRGGIARFDGAVDYLWILDGDNSLYRHGPGIEVLGISRLGGGLESVEIAPAWQLLWKSGVSVDLEANGHYEDVAVPFQLGDATIPRGQYRFVSIRSYVTLPSTWPVSSRFYARYGQYYDGQWSFIIVAPYWRPSQHLELGVDYERTRAEFPNREERFDSDVVRFRAHGAMNRALSLSVFVQYNSLSERLSADTRLRYNFAEGRDLFIIYNEGLTVDPTTHRLRALGERSILLKLSYTLIQG
jgi:hypothetical protein